MAAGRRAASKSAKSLNVMCSWCVPHVHGGVAFKEKEFILHSGLAKEELKAESFLETKKNLDPVVAEWSDWFYFLNNYI